MSKATAILEPGKPVVLPPAGHISFEIEPASASKWPAGGRAGRGPDLVQSRRSPRASVDTDSRAVNLNWKLTAPHALYSIRTRADVGDRGGPDGENYCGGGYCTEHLNIARYGDEGRGQPTARRIWTAIGGYGMDRCSFNVDACFNVFMTVAYDANGKWEIRLPKGKPGDHILMRALMPQIVAISNCPILFNACNNFRLKPLTVEIMR